MPKAQCPTIPNDAKKRTVVSQSQRTRERSSTEDNGAMKALRFGPTAGAATPAVVAAALPRSGGAEQRRGDVASLAYVAEVEGAA